MSINSDITRKIDLENNDGLSAWRNHSAQQSHHAYGIFWDFIHTTKPNRILEIGTALGGFTNFLDYACRNYNLNTKILSYDISERSWYKEMVSDTIDVKVQNIFNESYTRLIDSSVSDFIGLDGRAIVLCDGGCKVCEFNILSQYLKKDDIIMTHDYAPTTEYFNTTMKGKVWNWHEIKDSDIQLSIDKYNLKPFMHEEMVSVAWGSFIKE